MTPEAWVWLALTALGTPAAAALLVWYDAVRTEVRRCECGRCATRPDGSCHACWSRAINLRWRRGVA